MPRLPRPVVDPATLTEQDHKSAAFNRITGGLVDLIGAATDYFGGEAEPGTSFIDLLNERRARTGAAERKYMTETAKQNADLLAMMVPLGLGIATRPRTALAASGAMGATHGFVMPEHGDLGDRTGNAAVHGGIGMLTAAAGHQALKHAEAFGGGVRTGLQNQRRADRSAKTAIEREKYERSRQMNAYQRDDRLRTFVDDKDEEAGALLVLREINEKRRRSGLPEISEKEMKDNLKSREMTNRVRATRDLAEQRETERMQHFSTNSSSKKLRALKKEMNREVLAQRHNRDRVAHGLPPIDESQVVRRLADADRPPSPQPHILDRLAKAAQHLRSGNTTKVPPQTPSDDPSLAGILATAERARRRSTQQALRQRTNARQARAERDEAEARRADAVNRTINQRGRADAARRRRQSEDDANRSSAGAALSKLRPDSTAMRSAVARYDEIARRLHNQGGDALSSPELTGHLRTIARVAGLQVDDLRKALERHLRKRREQ
ncbi:MAG: hypothetical protein AAFQ35_12405 [Pseudomonadota bacterium]